MARKYITILTNEDKPVNDPHALVSVVVPIYNAGAHLDRTIKSIRSQRYKRLEILCINDGSTDNSLEIIKAHAAKDARIKVIDKPNEGYGATCNRGLAAATGDWVAIVEPTDWIDENMYGDMLMFASNFMTRIDIVKTPYWRVMAADTHNQAIYNCAFKKSVKQSTHPFKITEEPELLRHHPCIWSALYRKSFLTENNIRMREIPGAGWADNPFMIETYCRAQAIVYLDRAFYYYCEEGGSDAKKFRVENWRVPFERWNEMQAALVRLGVEDAGVLATQVKRGFNYVSGVLQDHNLRGSAEFEAAMKQMFEQMPPELVWREKEISPGQKRLYARVMGVAAPRISRAGHAKYLLNRGRAAVKNMGVKQAFGYAKNFAHVFGNRARALGAGSEDAAAGAGASSGVSASGSGEVAAAAGGAGVGSAQALGGAKGNAGDAGSASQKEARK